MSEQKQVRHSCPIPLKDQTGKEPACPFCTTTKEETISTTGVCKGNGGNGIVETITRTEVCDNSFVREVKLPTAWYEEWNKVADFMAKAELYLCMNCGKMFGAEDGICIEQFAELTQHRETGYPKTD